MRSQAKLRVVGEASIEETLTEAFAGLAEAERTAARFRAIIAEEGRALAKDRGVAFIRFEGLKREFGGE